MQRVNLRGSASDTANPSLAAGSKGKALERLLAHGIAIGFEADAGTLIRVTRGRVWLTETGSPVDYFLAAGEGYRAMGVGRIVCEGDSAAPAQLIVETG